MKQDCESRFLWKSGVSRSVQAKALRNAGCRRIFEETASSGRWDRPELHRMLDQSRNQ
jgi:DNA invertase Pin-like site-specific DNA recombinase